MSATPSNSVLIPGIASIAVLVLLLGASGCDGTGTGPQTSETKTQAQTAFEFQSAQLLSDPPVYENGRESEFYAILESLGGGIGVIDLDKDGAVDLILARGGHFKDDQVVGLGTDVYRSRFGQLLTRQTQEAQNRQISLYSHGVTVCDIDNDGFPDYFVSGYTGVVFYHNQGDGTLQPHQERIGLTDKQWATSMAAGDFDGDGDPDLYVAHYVNWSLKDNNPDCPSVRPERDRDVCPPRTFDGLPDSLFFNDGQGGFKDESSRVEVPVAGKGLGVLAADFDSDQDLDIYVANDTTDNFFFRNDSGGKFTEVGLTAGTALDATGAPNGSMGLAVLDANLDGETDVWVTNFEEELPALYHNIGNSQFLHVSRDVGISAVGNIYVGFGTVTHDFDCDGDEDIVVSNGHVTYFPTASDREQIPLLLENQSGRFRIATGDNLGKFFSTPVAGRGLALADMNQDGLSDLIASPSEKVVQTTTSVPKESQSWIRLRLTGTSSTRDAIGAKVVLRQGKQTQVRQIAGGGSYLSTSEYDVFFGLPDKSASVSIDVHWPSGLQQTFTDLSPKTVYILRESFAEAVNIAGSH